MKQPFRNLFISILTSVFLMSAVPALMAQLPPHNTMCPVMIGSHTKEKFFVDYENTRIYLCCRSCLKAFQRNPKKYLKRMARSGKTKKSRIL